jgi:hypothetical protein
VLHSARAGRFVLEIAVIQVVIVGKFLSSFDLSNCGNDDFAINFVSFTIRIAAVINKGTRTVAVDHVRSVDQAEQIGARRVFVQSVGLGDRNSRARIFSDKSFFLDWLGGVAPISMDFRTANHQGHEAEAFQEFSGSNAMGPRSSYQPFCTRRERSRPLGSPTWLNLATIDFTS